jgi:hypothetical protein
LEGKDEFTMFFTEQALVESFLEKLPSGTPWKATNFKVEFNYMRGKTDVIVVSTSNELIAIEAKLSKWRNAMQQAYRNRCFADKSYVLLPYNTAQLACCYEHEFNRRGVGICSILDGKIVILKEATVDEPIQPWLRQIALQFAVEG